MPRARLAFLALFVSLALLPFGLASQEPAPPTQDPASSAQEPASSTQDPLAAFPTRPAATVTPWAHAGTDLQPDPRIHYGAFDNGMRWAWVSHPEPQQRVYVRLHVDVGSLAETDAERGMAHFLEHMAFNGSENFAAGTLVEWFQEQGMAFGADTNAHTGFSETVYKLDLPDRDEETLREGLQVLRDFAVGLTIAADEVEAEKGVIDSEERERESASFRALVKLLESQYAGTRYAHRLPIGTKEARDAFTAESVRAFYERWYRPENFTLVVVGDLGERDPVPLIAEYFADIPAPDAPALGEPEAGTPTLDAPFFAVQDDELPAMQLTMARLTPHEEPADSRVERLRELRLGVARAIVNLRFQEKIKEEGTPYLAATVTAAGQFDLLRGGALQVAAAPTQWGEALEEAYVELRRALDFGFDQAELDEVRADWLRSIDEAVEREPKAHSAGLREAILLEVEEGVVPTSAAFDRELFRPALETLTVDQCLEALRDDWRGGTLSVTAVGPVEVAEPEATFTRIVERAREREIERGEEVAAASWAYASEAASAGEVVERDHVEDLDVHRIRYANGVRLNVKATDFREREIGIRVETGRGRLALPADGHAVRLLGGSAYVGGGLEAHDADALRRLMADRQAGAALTVADDRFVWSGGTTSDDFLFQCELLRAFLEHPGWRDDPLVVFRRQIPLVFEQFRHTAQGPLVFDFVPALLDGDPRAGLLGLTRFASQEELAGLTMEAVRAALGESAREGPIEITVVGDCEVDAIIDAVGRTFGAMPEAPVPMLPMVMPEASFTPGISLTRTIDTADEKATLTMVFPTTDGIDTRTRRHLSFLGTVVDDRLRLHVREALGAAYSPSAGAAGSRVWLHLGGVRIDAAGDPAGAEELRAACREVAETLATEGVTQEEVDRLVAPLLKQLRDSQRQNAFWLDVLAEAQTRPESLDEIRSLIDAYESLDVAFLNELAAEYLLPERASALLVLPATED